METAVRLLLGLIIVAGALLLVLLLATRALKRALRGGQPHGTSTRPIPWRTT